MIGSEIDPDEARAVAEDILRRPEFRAEEPSLLDRAVEWVLGRLGDVLDAVLPGGGDWLGWMVLLVALALVTWLIWRFAPRRLLPARRREPGPTHEVVSGRTREQWLAEAERAESDGAWARVVHARWHALVAGLAARSQLADDPAATSGEHRRTFARSAVDQPGRVDRFSEATSRFEDVWFGGRPADRADGAALVDDDRALVLDAGESGR